VSRRTPPVRRPHDDRSTASPRAVAIVGAGLLAALVAGCASDPPASSAELPAVMPEVTADPVVDVVDSRFEPEVVTVVAGTEVVWEWDARIGHDVVGDGFDSSIKLEGTFEHTFDEPGTYPYVCTLHPGMEGTVLVVEE
jgi:plastocyanin